MAPFQLLNNLKAAHEAVGKRDSLEGLTIGVRLAAPALKVVTQPHHAQFVISSVPDDVAAAFDCESRLTLGASKKIARAYGNYYGATFYISGHQDQKRGAALGQGERLLEDRLVGHREQRGGLAGSRGRHRGAVGAHQVGADPGRVGAALPRGVARRQGLRCRVQVPLDEELRVLRPGAEPEPARFDLTR